MILQNDFNTTGYAQWYNFKVKNKLKNTTIKLNIVNMVFLSIISVQVQLSLLKGNETLGIIIERGEKVAAKHPSSPVLLKWYSNWKITE